MIKMCEDLKASDSRWSEYDEAQTYTEKKKTLTPLLNFVIKNISGLIVTNIRLENTIISLCALNDIWFDWWQPINFFVYLYICIHVKKAFRTM